MRIKGFFYILVFLLLALGSVLLFLSSQLNTIFFYIGEGLILFILIYLTFFYRKIVKPLNTIGSGMELLREQDFSSRLSPVGQYEADRVVNIFNRMMEQLKNERLRLREQNNFLDLLIKASPMGVIITSLDEDLSELNPMALKNDPVSDFDWLIKMLVNVVCRDGNLLLNIGPDRNGKVSEEIHQRIRQIGDWLSRCGESIYNTRGGPFEPEDEVYGTTFRENRIYLHILDTAAFAGRRLPDPGVRIRRCYLLGTEEDTPFEQGEEGLRITLPQGRKTTPQDPDCIVVLELDGKVPQKEENEVYFTGKE